MAGKTAGGLTLAGQGTLSFCAGCGRQHTRRPACDRPPSPTAQLREGCLRGSEEGRCPWWLPGKPSLGITTAPDIPPQGSHIGVGNSGSCECVSLSRASIFCVFFKYWVMRDCLYEGFTSLIERGPQETPLGTGKKLQTRSFLEGVGNKQEGFLLPCSTRDKLGNSCRLSSGSQRPSQLTQRLMRHDFGNGGQGTKFGVYLSYQSPEIG